MIKRLTGNRMEPMFNRLVVTSIIYYVLMAVLGAIFFIKPVFTNKMIGIIMGIVFILHGLGIGYRFIKRDGAKLYLLNIIFALLVIAIGILLIIYPYTVMNFVTVWLGIYFIVLGLLNINYGVWFLIGRDDAFLLTLIIGILIIALGILTITSPFASLEVTQVIGTMLMLTSVLKITNAILLKKRASEITKIFW